MALFFLSFSVWSPSFNLSSGKIAISFGTLPSTESCECRCRMRTSKHSEMTAMHEDCAWKKCIPKWISNLKRQIECFRYNWCWISCQIDYDFLIIAAHRRKTLSKNYRNLREYFLFENKKLSNSIFHFSFLFFNYLMHSAWMDLLSSSLGSLSIWIIIIWKENRRCVICMRSAYTDNWFDALSPDLWTNGTLIIENSYSFHHIFFIFWVNLICINDVFVSFPSLVVYSVLLSLLMNNKEIQKRNEKNGTFSSLSHSILHCARSAVQTKAFGLEFTLFFCSNGSDWHLKLTRTKFVTETIEFFITLLFLNAMPFSCSFILFFSITQFTEERNKRRTRTHSFDFYCEK